MPVLDVRVPTLDVRVPTLDVRVPTLDVRVPTLDVRVPPLLSVFADSGVFAKCAHHRSLALTIDTRYPLMKTTLLKTEGCHTKLKDLFISRHQNAGLHVVRNDGLQ